MNSAALENSTWRVDSVVEQKQVTWTHFTWMVRDYMNLKHKTNYCNYIHAANEKFLFALQKSQLFLKIWLTSEVYNKTMYFCIVNQKASCLFSEASDDGNGNYYVEFCNVTVSDRLKWFLQKGVLTISCRYISKPNLQKNIVLPFGRLKDTTHSNQVCRDLRNMYIRSIACDLSLQARITNFKVHKSVISARSPYLAGLIAQAKNNTLIVDVDPAIMNDVLLFMYSAELPDLILAKVFAMLNVANVLNIPSLRKKLMKHLKESICEENIYGILEEGIKNELTELVKQALSYIHNKIPHVMQFNDYRKLIQKANAML